MEWNNGTIFRAFINSGNQSVVDCKLDISQEDLNNKVFIGIENYLIVPDFNDDAVTPPDPPEVDPEKELFWTKKKYIQLESVQLTPYIDFTSQNSGDDEELNRQRSRNTSIFARIPIIYSFRLESPTDLTTNPMGIGASHVLNKDSILYEMRNNPHALSNGRLRFRMLDESGVQIPDKYINSCAFTLVVYKPDNNYN
jgi:hypothetical protein|tara:strand:- start:1104 stop:1694 length:591 start_codon:yes stop_codon:yes gene_type:complete